MIARLRRLAAWLTCTLVLTAVVGGCSSASSTSAGTTTVPVPSATALLASSATAMKSVTSAHFVLSVSGRLPALQVQGAQGDLSSAGQAKGSATITEFGQLVQVDFVIVGKVLYLKGPTGGYTKLAAALAGQIYDPTAILNTDKGVAAVLGHVASPGVPQPVGSLYTVTGTVAQAMAAALVPGITADSLATFTVDKASMRLTDVTLMLKGSDGQPATVDLALTDFNKPVTVSAPA